jgi:hypothetical protein
MLWSDGRRSRGRASRNHSLDRPSGLKLFGRVPSNRIANGVLPQALVLGICGASFARLLETRAERFSWVNTLAENLWRSGPCPGESVRCSVKQSMSGEAKRLANVGRRVSKALVGLCAVASLAASVAGANTALAQPATPTVAELLPKLAAANDSRVRAATVLQFGATNDDAAVAPLCKELSDNAEIVRLSAAIALRRLARPAALGCLKARVDPRSPNPEVAEGPKLQISRAIESLSALAAAPAAPKPAGGGNYDPPQHSGAKYYVALSPVASAADRPQAEVEAVVLRAIRQKLEGANDIQLAPMKESEDAAKKAIASRKGKGFYLSISVEKFDYSGGNLRVKVNIAIFSYPGKALIAPSGKAATMSGVAPGNHGAEDQLLEAVAGAAVKQFTENAAQM